MQQNSITEHKSNTLPYKKCLNCGSELKGMYCHECGQHATSETPTVVGFIMEYLNNAFLWDSKFLPTLWTLILRPGKLTNEYLSGKFISQEHPIKLNMFLLFVFITLFALFSSTEKMNDSVHNITNDERVFSGIQLNLLMENHEYVEKLKDSPKDTVQLLAPLLLAENYPKIISHQKTIEDTDGKDLDKWIAVLPHILIEDKIVVLDNNGYYRFNTESKIGKKEIEMVNSVWTEMVNLITKYFPMIVLFTAPFLSMSLCFVQRKSRIPRINHFIFSLHYIAFLEFLMMFIYILYLIASLPIEILECIMIIGSCLYLTIAFRKVYKIKTWYKAILKALFTNLIYFFIGLLIFIVIFLVACIIIANMSL